jgi:hypothetical protein
VGTAQKRIDTLTRLLRVIGRTQSCSLVATRSFAESQAATGVSLKAQSWVRGALIGGAIVLLLFGVGGFAIGTLVVSSIGSDSMARCEGHRKFERSVWLDSAATYGKLQLRGCMVDDLRRRHSFRGRTRAEVVALLGEPRPTGYFDEYDLVYWLGPERSAVAMDSEWLAIRLDKVGRVTEHQLVTD